MSFFKNLKSEIDKIVSDRGKDNEEVFDPRSFHHPLASVVEWTPLKGGGANFKTCELKFDEMQSKLEVKPTNGMILFCAVFWLIGACTIVGSIASIIFYEFNFTAVFLFFFGAIFLSVGLGMRYFALIPKVFDKRIGYYFVGEQERPKEGCLLDEIVAIQIIDEQMKNSKGYKSYFSFEINLVLKNAKRINVIDHGEIAVVRKQAADIQNFLGQHITVWDSTVARH